jgi:hypothetical protein
MPFCANAPVKRKKNEKSVVYAFMLGILNVNNAQDTGLERDKGAVER